MTGSALGARERSRQIPGSAIPTPTAGSRPPDRSHRRVFGRNSSGSAARPGSPLTGHACRWRLVYWSGAQAGVRRGAGPWVASIEVIELARRRPSPYRAADVGHGDEGAPWNSSRPKDTPSPGARLARQRIGWPSRTVIARVRREFLAACPVSGVARRLACTLVLEGQMSLHSGRA